MVTGKNMQNSTAVAALIDSASKRIKMLPIPEPFASWSFKGISAVLLPDNSSVFFKPLASIDRRETSDAMIYHGRENTWENLPGALAPRVNPDVLPLANGRIGLFGQKKQFTPLSPFAEVFDPLTKAFSPLVDDLPWLRPNGRALYHNDKYYYFASPVLADPINANNVVVTDRNWQILRSQLLPGVNGTWPNIASLSQSKPV